MIADKLTQENPKHVLKFVRLSDGRRLAYSEYGVPDGKPVLYCHGHPGSRLDPGMYGGEVLEQSGLRLICPDRPGIGQSDIKPGRRIVDWPADVSELASDLSLDSFSVLGISGGGPFAAVTAQALPERVKKLALVSSVGRFDVPGATQGMGPGLIYFRMARYVRWLCKLQLRMMAYGMKADPQRVVVQVKSSMPPADSAAIDRPGVMNAFLVTLAEFLRQGSHGPALEASLYMRPWGFPLDEIKTPTHLWHGQADQNAPVAMGRDLSERIPNCQAKFAPDEGHFSLIINSAPEVFGFLVQE
jgi:pimeloyl-ACP methyl ester carboxylesterase